MPQRSYGFETGDFQRVKTQASSLPAPPKPATAPAGGVGPPSQPPSSNGWQQFRGKSFGVSHPSNWQVFGDAQASMVTIAPREGLVQSGNNTQVAYGAILSYFTPEAAGDLKNATDGLVSHLHASNPTMRVARSAQKSLVAGTQGLVTLLESDSPYGGKETDALLTVSRPEGLFYLVFIAPAKDFPQLQNTFQQMVNSLQFGG